MLSPKKKNYDCNVDLFPRSRHLLIEQDLMVDCGGTENLTTGSHRDRRKKGGERLGGGRFLASSICLLPHDAHRDAHGRRRSSSPWREADVVCVRLRNY